MDIDRVSVLVDFEVIEIVDEINPYPGLLGIDWANDMNGVINLKKPKITLLDLIIKSQAFFFELFQLHDPFFQGSINRHI